MKRICPLIAIPALYCLLAAPGCSTPPSSGPDIQDPTTPVASADIPYGAQCTPTEDFGQGTCADGLVCFPMPNGYCAGLCGDGVNCGEGGVCIESHRGGQGCARACERDTDCRADEGYVCDPVWNACILPGVMPVAPRPPQCSGDRLAKAMFGPATQLSTPAGGSSGDTEVHAAVNARGDVTAAYISMRPRGKPNPLGLSTLSTDGKVAGDRVLPDSRENHFDPWMARDRAGTLYLTWLGFDGGAAPEKRMQIGFASSADGITWTESIAAHDAATDCPGEAPGCLDKPVMAVGPDVSDPRRDAIYIAYSATRGQRVVKSIDGGRSFSSSVKASNLTYGDIEVDARGHLYLINTTASPRGPATFGDPNGRIEFVRSTDGGGTFSEPIVVSAAGESIPGLFVNPQIASDPDRGVIYAVYPAGTSDMRWNMMLAVSSDNGATWKRTQINDDAPCANHMLPAAALDSRTGQLHVTWIDNRDGAGLVAYASCDAAARCTPNQRVSDAPFAAYSFARHATMWLGEYSALIIDDARRTLHAVWAQPVDEGGVPRSRIFHARGQLP